MPICNRKFPGASPNPKSLKRYLWQIEEVYLNEYATEAKTGENIGAFIKALYNINRLHSSLGYRSSDEFEALYSLCNAA